MRSPNILKVETTNNNSNQLLRQKYTNNENLKITSHIDMIIIILKSQIVVKVPSTI